MDGTAVRERAAGGAQSGLVRILSDAGSATIRAYGLPNQDMDPARAPEDRREMMRRFFGIPHSGTFVLDRSGRVTARIFEEAVQERSTTSSIAVRVGDATAGAPERAATRVATNHIEGVAWATDDTVAPGNPVIRLCVTVPQFLRSHEMAYPPSELYRFEALDETVIAIVSRFVRYMMVFPCGSRSVR